MAAWRCTKVDIAMPLEVENCKRAHVAQFVDVDSKLCATARQQHFSVQMSLSSPPGRSRQSLVRLWVATSRG